MKTFFNILRGIAAFFLSVFLFSALIGGVFVYGTSAFIQEDVITGVVSELDGADLVAEGTELYVSIVDMGLDPKAFGQLLNTEAVDEIIELYVGDAFRVIENKGEILSFTNENVEKIVDKHMQELMPIVKDVFQVTEDLPEDYLREQVHVFVEAITETIPTIEDLGLSGPNMTSENMEVLQGIQALHSGVIVVPLVGIAVVLSLLILLCRYQKFEGFIWLAVVYFLSGGLTFGFGNLLQRNIPIDSTFTAAEAMILPAVNTFGSKLFLGGIILVMVAVACLVVAIVGKKIKKNKVNNELMVE